MWSKKCWILAAPSLRSDSDSELSPSDSGGEETEEDKDREEEEQKTKKEEKENLKSPTRPSKGLSAALYKTPAKKSKNTPEPLNQPSMVEEYFEAHGSSKVLTSDRTLQRLNTPKLDRVSTWQPVFSVYSMNCVIETQPDFVFAGNAGAAFRRKAVLLLERDPAAPQQTQSAL